jgi:hypothetical protein
MKVRFRNPGMAGGMEFEVLEESPNFYIVNGTDGHCSLRKSNYEPVPTERWVDVTAECSIGSVITNNVGMPNSWREWQFSHNGKTVNSNYRLRKVHTYEGWDGRALDSNSPVYAFIVEQKVST